MKEQPVRVVPFSNRAFRPVLAGLAVASCCLSFALLSGCNSAVASSDSKAAPPSPSEVAARLAKLTAGLKPITGTIDFNEQIRPIMSEGCFACHGPDANMRKAGLRLDYADPAEAPLPDNPSGHAVVPGHPEQSEIIARITSSDPKERMPHGAPALKPQQIQMIAEWIKQGAPYEPIWSLIAPKATPVPNVGALQSRVVNPIDNYVFAKLAEKGMSPSPEADRATLINRVSLTLTGLPPTLAETDAFVNDKSPNAYEKVVDRLLASPAYGENLAGLWMDVSRWADSDGYENDGIDFNLYPWRDWVINSFNQNMPYDKFVTMQVAGDTMPNPTRDDLVATEWLRLGMRASEAGDLNEQYRIETVVDDTQTVGTALLGYTVGCARCHDHKFDPISQKDFYELSGFFNSLNAPGTGITQGGPTLDWPTAAQEEQLIKATRALDAATDSYQRVMAADIRKDQTEVAAWLNSSGSSVASTTGPARVVRTSLVESSAAPSNGNEAAKLIQTSLDKAQVGYYPFDSLEPIPADKVDMLRLGKPSRGDFAGFGRFPYPHRDGVKAGSPFGGRAGAGGKAFAGGRAGAGRRAGPPNQEAVAKSGAGNPEGGTAPIAKKAANQGGYNSDGGLNLQGKVDIRVPTTYKLDEMEFSPSGVPGALPAIVSVGKLVPGHKGQALYITESNDGNTYLPHEKGATKSVGEYERYEQFSVDMWFKPAKRYDTYTSVFWEADTPSADTIDNGRAGYEMVYLEDGRLEFFLSHARPYNMIALRTKAPLELKKWAHIAVTYDGSSKAGGTHLYLDGVEAPVDVVSDHLTQGMGFPRGGSGLYSEYTGFGFGTRFHETGPVGSAIDEVRIFDRSLTPLEVGYLHEGAKALKTVSRSALSGQLAQLLAIRDPAAIQARQALDMARKAENGIQTAIPQTLIYQDLAQPRPTYLLYRGEWDSRREQVPSQGPAQLFAWSDKYPRTRLGLMQWMFDPKNPLPARVFVNRLWQVNFGQGLVTTPDDFGSQGIMPTYLHLEDYLALKFIDSGWNIKQMEKMIVMSATYRQSSKATAAQRVADPKNDLLGRGPRFRETYRQIRDSAIFDAGLLDQRLGGPSTFPYQPAGVTRGYPAPMQMPDWEQHRRTLYSLEKRNEMNPQLQLLDTADPTVSQGKEGLSNTPMQALLLLNGPQYLEAYRVMASNAMHTSSDTSKQIAEVYRVARRQYPDATQMALLNSIYDTKLKQYQADKDSARKLVSVGVAPVDGSVDVAKWAALTTVATVIMDSPDSYFVQ
ncbi:MAG TPA: DUF1549 domain-containing protein [Steroidobacteraceae bacterium]|nr:DUF1549 domain-containing protein [Steroidobacteraceae bacterium]